MRLSAGAATRRQSLPRTATGPGRAADAASRTGFDVTDTGGFPPCA